MNKSPEISVVMSVYNGSDKLEETLTSILSQQGVELEFIVVNDGSTDGTLSKLQQYAKNDSRLRILDQENTGLTCSLIRGCAEAKGKFIARQDAGDISLPGRLFRQAELLNEKSEVALVGCDYTLVTPDNEIMRDKLPDLDASKMEKALGKEDNDLYGPHHGTVMFRRSIYESVGGYRKAFYFAQDLDLWTRLVEQGNLALIPDVLCRTQFSTGSLSGRYRDQQQQLKRLIGKAAVLRRAGEVEKPVLRLASKIRPDTYDDAKSIGKTFASTSYFIGSCLANRGDSAAQKYFKQAIRKSPFHLKAWAKLLSVKLKGIVNQ